MYRVVLWLGIGCACAWPLTGISAEGAEAPPIENHASDPPIVLAETPLEEVVTAGIRPRDVKVVSQLTGEVSLNRTAERWGVHGTDLGHMFWHEGRLYMVFGDTFGEGGLGGKHWRSNVMARVADPDPRSGLPFETMITDAKGRAKELIPSKKVNGIEKTVIPTYGVSAGGRMYLHYMSVRRWGDGGGQWEVGHSGLAYSDDEGATWVKPPEATWPGGGGFDQVAMVNTGGYVYSLGIPQGRFGGVRLRRVPEADMLHPDRHEYWNGNGWTKDPGAAAVIVPPPVGELSVLWSAHHRRWIMTYLNSDSRAVVLRTAPALAGPWSGEQVLLSAEEFPGLYGPFLVPGQEAGEELWFTLSLWGKYNVFLAHARIETEEKTEPPTRTASR